MFLEEIEKELLDQLQETDIFSPVEIYDLSIDSNGYHHFTYDYPSCYFISMKQLQSRERHSQHFSDDEIKGRKLFTGKNKLKQYESLKQERDEEIERTRKRKEILEKTKKEIQNTIDDLKSSAEYKEYIRAKRAYENTASAKELRRLTHKMNKLRIDDQIYGLTSSPLIGDLKVSNRIFNTLIKVGCFTIDHFGWAVDEHDIPGFGEKSMAELREAVKEFYDEQKQTMGATNEERYLSLYLLLKSILS